jgi:hypothetical protein
VGTKPGNAAATTVSVAGVAMAAPDEDDCKKLDDKNKKDRQTLQTTEELSPSEQKAVAGPGSTITNYKFRPARGRASSAAATNRNESNSVDENHFKKGADETTRKQKKSNGCIAAYRYSGQGKRSSGHAESRIVETIFGKNPGKPNPGILLVNVDLLKNGKDAFGRAKKSKMPCGHCHRLLCAAKKCDIVVFCCDKNNKPQELTDEMCEKGVNTPVKQSKRRKLKKAMGELGKGK